MKLIHGGDIAGYEIRYGHKPLDFSASLNPLGMPERVVAAAQKAVAEATPYPDPLCRQLTAALSARLDVPAECIFCGNGAADVIFRLVQALKPAKALLVEPTFAEYEEALAAQGCGIRRHRLDEANRFRPDAGILADIEHGIDIMFLCQPNNPTGHLTDPGLLEAVLDRCEELGVFLVVDECFLSFVRDAARFSLMREVSVRKRLFILDSFTKLYGMAGIRLGYGVCGDADLIERLRRAGQPWSVSTVAQAAGLASLKEEEYVKDTLEVVRIEKEWLSGELVRLGLDVIGGEANYLFFHAGVPDLVARLADAGILVRDCRNFHGLRAGHIRVAVRTREDNARLVAALDTIMGR